MLDAIARATVRMLVTRRRLLEWMTADRAENGHATVWTVARRMWPAPVVALGIAALVAVVAPGRLLLAESHPHPVVHLAGARLRLRAAAGASRRRPSSRSERSRLREVARRTWRFFEELVGPADHWLVPDNYQEDRHDVIAHRTSPTNIGLQLLSTLAACDFGYLSYAGVLDRLEPTFDTLLRMQRYRGHFYNWYDTRTLAPLVPAYISTVDSGNLAGYLLTLRSGLASLADTGPLIDGSVLEGLEDAINLFEAEVDALNRGRATSGLKRELGSLRTQLARRPGTALEWRRLLTQLEERLQAVSILFHDVFYQFEEPLVWRPADRDAAGGARMRPRRGSSAPPSVLSTRQLELERLTGWMTRLQAAGIRDIPAERPEPHRAHHALRPGAQRSRRAPGVERGAAGHRAGAAARGGAASSAASGWARSPTTSSKRPSSGSCSTPSGSCSRSASASPTAGSTTRTTTRSRPRRGSRASWPSRPARSRTSTGSSSAGR